MLFLTVPLKIPYCVWRILHSYSMFDLQELYYSYIPLVAADDSILQRHIEVHPEICTCNANAEGSKRFGSYNEMHQPIYGTPTTKSGICLMFVNCQQNRSLLKLGLVLSISTREQKTLNRSLLPTNLKPIPYLTKTLNLTQEGCSCLLSISDG